MLVWNGLNVFSQWLCEKNVLVDQFSKSRNEWQWKTCSSALFGDQVMPTIQSKSEFCPEANNQFLSIPLCSKVVVYLTKSSNENISEPI